MLGTLIFLQSTSPFLLSLAFLLSRFPELQEVLCKIYLVLDTMVICGEIGQEVGHGDSVYDFRVVVLINNLEGLKAFGSSNAKEASSASQVQYTSLATKTS